MLNFSPIHPLWHRLRILTMFGIEIDAEWTAPIKQIRIAGPVHLLDIEKGSLQMKALNLIGFLISVSLLGACDPKSTNDD